MCSAQLQEKSEISILVQDRKRTIVPGMRPAIFVRIQSMGPRDRFVHSTHIIAPFHPLSLQARKLMGRSMFLSIFLILLTAGCTTATASITPESQIIVPPTSTLISLSLAATPSPTPERATEAPKPPEEPLSDKGPWWVFQADDGLWAVNPNGSGLTQILDRSGERSELRAYRYAPSPNGGILALVEVADTVATTAPMLGLLSLPGGMLTPVTNLLPTDLDYGAMDPGQFDTAFTRWAAVGVANSISWSPDGHWLAYSGAQDGPSSDLYIYSLEDDASTRLTDGPTETVSPTWSPDGQRIVHAAVKTLNWDASGLGYLYTGVWSANADNSGVELLLTSDFLGFENILGWLTDTRFLLDTLDSGQYAPDCWLGDLRTVDLESGEITLVLEGRYIARAFDPFTLAVAFGVADDADCDQSLISGLYLLYAGPEISPLRLAEDEPSEIEWSDEMEMFFIRTKNGVLAADRFGNVLELVAPETSRGLPTAAPNSFRLAWTGDELWIGLLTDSIENPPRRIFKQPVREASWSPDGEHLLFMTSEGLYVASGPNFDPIQLGDFGGRDPVWVLPRSDGD